MYKSWNSEELLEAVKELANQGLGRVVIARKLNISDSKATRILRKLKGEELIKDPGVVAQVTNLISLGKSPKSIKEALEDVLDDKEVGSLTTSITETIEDYEAPCDLEQGEWEGMTPKERFELMKQFMDLGIGRLVASKKCKITEETARYWMQKVKLNMSRASTVDKVREMLDDQADGYDVAKRFSKTPGAANSLIKKAECIYSPVDDWVKKATKSGILYSRLKNLLSLKSKAKAVEIIKENFPSCFVIETPMDDGDVLLTPVINSKQQLTKLDIDPSKRPFEVGIVSHNYMVAKIDDSYGDDSLTIFDLTDIHVGAKKFRKQEFLDIINTIKETPGALVVLGGDLIEAVTKISVADQLDQYESINDQAVECIELLLPVANIIVCQEWGNHCGGRTEKAAQFDLARTMATMLKVPYFRERVLVEFHWRGQVKRVSLAHKYGNAHRKPQIELAVERIKSWSNYEISCFFSGHTHESFILPKQAEHLVPGRPLQISRYFICNGGSFLGRQDTYASREGYSPTPQDVVYYGFYDTGKDFTGALEIDCD